MRALFSRLFEACGEVEIAIGCWASGLRQFAVGARINWPMASAVDPASMTCGRGMSIFGASRLPQFDAWGIRWAPSPVGRRDTRHIGPSSKTFVMALQGKVLIKLRSLTYALCLTFCLPLHAAQAQSEACALRPSKHNPDEKILRCGRDLIVEPAPGTIYRPVDPGGRRPPAAIQLDGGGLLIEFHPTERRRDFQILTPLAITAVRGTNWAVEATLDRTSCLVLTGAVNVSRANGAAKSVVLRRGEGVDVTPGAGPLQVKRWRPERIRALLARFGR